MNMVETFAVSIQGTMDYYECGDFPFNFFFVYFLPKGDDDDRSVNASNVARSINLWLDNMPAGKTANWVVSVRLGKSWLLMNDLAESYYNFSSGTTTSGGSEHGTERSSWTRST